MTDQPRFPGDRSADANPQLRMTDQTGADANPQPRMADQASAARPPRPRRRKPSSYPVIAGSLATFMALFGFLAYQLRTGHDPSLSHAQSAQAPLVQAAPSQSSAPLVTKSS